MEKQVVEVVTFSAAPGTTPEAMAIAGNRIKPWLTDQPGFVRRVMAIAEDGRWMDCVTWSNMECARAAAASMPSASGADEFMAAIAMESVVVNHYQTELEI